MIVRPIVILGAPRSGTSLLQRILRVHPAIWSLPSESEMIWHQYCHPRLNGWRSECYAGAGVDHELRVRIHHQFERMLAPASLWRTADRHHLAWVSGGGRIVLRKLKPLYQAAYPVLSLLLWRHRARRMVDKSISNCFRVDFIHEVFPDAKFLFITRNGGDCVRSLMRGWLQKDRFFSYQLPVTLAIPDYPHALWNFNLPPGWEHFADKSLADVCAFQWRESNNSILQVVKNPDYRDQVLRVKLEEMVSAPARWLKTIFDFCELESVAELSTFETGFPVVNGATDAQVWAPESVDREVSRIMPMIADTMAALDYCHGNHG